MSGSTLTMAMAMALCFGAMAEAGSSSRWLTHAHQAPALAACQRHIVTNWLDRCHDVARQWHRQQSTQTALMPCQWASFQIAEPALPLAAPAEQQQPAPLPPLRSQLLNLPPPIA